MSYSGFLAPIPAPPQPTGGGGNGIFFENAQTVLVNYTISTDRNAMSAGPINIATGITVTIPAGSTWSII